MAASDDDVFSEAGGEGPGRRLRLAREDRGLSMAEVADALHLSRAMVEALEADDYDNLPPATFVKGYLRAYGEYLALDEEPLVQAYERYAQSEDSRPLTPAVGTESAGKRRRRWLWLVLALVILVVAGAAGVLTTDVPVPSWAEDAAETAREAVEETMTTDGDNGGEPAGDDAGDGESPAGTPPDADAESTSSASGDETTGGDRGKIALDEAALEEAAAAGSPAEALPDTTDRDTTAAADYAGDDTSDNAPSRDTGGMMDDDPLGGSEAILQPEDLSGAPVDGDSEDFGGPLSEAPPEPGTGEMGQDGSEAAGNDAGEASDGEQAGDSGAGPDVTESAVSTPSGSGDDALTSGDAADGVVAPARESETSPRADDDVNPSELETIELSVSGQSWIEIRDSRDQRLVFELITEPGQKRVAGVPPFEVVVGEVENVTMSYNGEAVDLKDYSRQGMARFELGGQ